MTKIISIIGENSQLAQYLSNDLSNYQIQLFNRSHLNLLDLKKIKSILSKSKHDVIINTAGNNNVENIENDKNEFDNANIVNNLALREIAEFCDINNILFVSYSTDYVFDGNKSEPYSENDITNPMTKYGITKNNGELSIIESNCNYLLLRVSWLYSDRPHNFLYTILNSLKRQTEIRVVDDQVGIPTSCSFVSYITFLLLDKLFQNNSQFKLNKIIHVTPNGNTTWYEYANIIEKIIYNRDSLIHKSLIKNISTDQYLKQFNTSIQRPYYSVLCNIELQKNITNDIQSWQWYLYNLFKKSNKLQDYLKDMNFN
jgi:dTDP-4-dehydrorhamnose reductase